MSFFGRVFHWIANEIIVKTLAENRSFQRFAMRTDDYLQNNVFRKSDDMIKSFSTQAQSMMKEVKKNNKVINIAMDIFKTTKGKRAEKNRDVHTK